MKYHYQGFTLLEMIVVIVLLGVLAVTAAPKFLSLQTNSKTSLLESAEDTLRTASAMVYAKAVVAGKDGPSDSIEINGVEVPLQNGYPSLYWDAADSDRMSFQEINSTLKAWANIDSTDRNTASRDPDVAPFFSDRASSLGDIYLFLSEDYDNKSISFACQVRYRNKNGQVSIRVLTDAC